MKFAWFSNFSLSKQLLLLLAGILPLLWGIIAWDLSSRRELGVTNGERHIHNLVLAFSEEVRSSVTAIDRSLLSLRDDWTQGEEAFGRAVERWRNRLDHEVVLQIAVIDAKGILQYSSLNPEIKGTDLSDREHYQVHRENGSDRLFISKPVRGRVSGQLSIQLTRPLLDSQGRFDGVIVLSVQPDYFSRFYHSLEFDEGTAIALARQSGEVLAKSPTNEAAIGKHFSEFGYNFNLRDPYGTTITVPEAGDEGFMYGWRLLPQGELVVSLKQPMHVLMSDYLQHRRTMLLGGAGVSLLIALICYVILSNLRERMKAAALVMQSETRWKYALQGAGDGVWDWDLRSDTMTYSAQWKAMLGYDDDDVINSRSKWEQLVHPEDLPGVRQALQAHFDDEAIPYRSEQRMRTRKGAWIWILDRGAAMLRTSQGQPLRLVGTHTDITQRKLDEAALHQSLEQIAMDRQRMRSILENSYDAFLATDAEGRIIDWNQQAERTFGWAMQEAIDKPLVDLIIPPAMHDDYGKVIDRIWQGNEEAIKGQRFEFTALHKSGREFPIELAWAIMRTSEGFTAHAFIRDITDRLEAARKEQERMRSLEEARNALFHSQKLEAVGKLTGGVAHDFNNMLQIISGNLQLLQLEFAGDEGAVAKLQNAIAAVGRGAKLSSQLLAFARRQPLQPVVVNINSVINNMHDLLRQAMTESIEIDINATGQARAVLIDPHQLDNVIINLALNAGYAMHSKGKLTIVVSDIVINGATPSLRSHLAEGDYVTVSVIDNGSGMTEDVLERAFEPFFTTKPDGEGTGLGLSMAYGFVKQSGGHIDIDSQVGKGTTITIYIPRVAVSSIPAAPKEEPSVWAGSGVVLVVEDDLEVQATTVGLVRALGYEVRKADGAQQALEILEKDESIDLLFTDVVMPGTMNGPELAEKASKIRPDLAVLFTSGYTRNAIGVQNVLKPDINMLPKPYHHQQLAKKLQQLLGTPHMKKLA